MKILLAGEYAWPWYQEACARALERLGCQVVRFGLLERFKKWVPGKAEPVYRSFAKRVQYRFLGGPAVWGINRDLIRLAIMEKPDIVWLYNAQLIYPATIRSLRKHLPEAIFCQYANDNPFSSLTRRSAWRHFIRSINLFDIHFAFRRKNIPDFYNYGAKNVFLLPPYFIPEDDYPINKEEIGDDYLCDVVFAGHYEDDGRLEALEAICKAGYKLKLYGGGWNRALAKLALDSPLRALYPIQPATGRNYNKAICGGKVALCFLSKLNQDVYTRRSFQIPAMKITMLSERTTELEKLFTDGEEAAFFSGREELLEKARNLLKDKEIRDRIANGGYWRVYRDGHDIKSRMFEWLGHIHAYRREPKNTLHFIQDIPTPHNNVLLNALKKEPAVDLRIWYARLTHPQYSFKPELGYAAGDPIVYGYRLPSWQLIKTALFNKKDKFFVVGWMNPTTRILLPLFWLLRRHYNMWFDLPARGDSSAIKKPLRKFYHFLLETSRAKVFVVGQNTVSYFKNKGFNEERIVNLPIFVELKKSPEEYRQQREVIRAKYGVVQGELFVVTGSRLIREKGFDLLLQAIAQIEEPYRAKIKLLIIGNGEEKDALIRQARDNKLERTVFFDGWMSSEDFMFHMGAADLAVHPARFDAYGGITLSAMAAGIPVIASYQAGSARDRIEHDVNGWLYEYEDISKLTEWLTLAFQRRDLLEVMGLAARQTAERFNSHYGARLIVENII